MSYYSREIVCSPCPLYKHWKMGILVNIYSPIICRRSVQHYFCDKWIFKQVHLARLQYWRKFAPSNSKQRSKTVILHEGINEDRAILWAWEHPPATALPAVCIDGNEQALHWQGFVCSVCTALWAAVQSGKTNQEMDLLHNPDWPQLPVINKNQ